MGATENRRSMDLFLLVFFWIIYESERISCAVVPAYTPEFPRIHPAGKLHHPDAPDLPEIIEEICCRQAPSLHSQRAGADQDSDTDELPKDDEIHFIAVQSVYYCTITSCTAGRNQPVWWLDGRRYSCSPAYL